MREIKDVRELMERMFPQTFFNAMGIELGRSIQPDLQEEVMAVLVKEVLSRADVAALELRGIAYGMLVGAVWQERVDRGRTL